MANTGTVTKYSQLARIIPFCCGCRVENHSDVVLAHRNRNAWGILSGRGIKSVSISGAFLCSMCHTWADSDGQNDAEFWELASGRSLTWAFQSGYLQFNPNGGDPDAALR